MIFGRRGRPRGVGKTAGTLPPELAEAEADLTVWQQVNRLSVARAEQERLARVADAEAWIRKVRNRKKAGAPARSRS